MDKVNMLTKEDSLKGVATKTGIDANKKYIIQINEQGDADGLFNVFASVNGESYSIVRGHKVVVPGYILLSLMDSIYTKQLTDKDTGKKNMKDILRFSLTNFGEASEKDNKLNRKLLST